MIYIIDDNKQRQINSGWSESKLNRYKEIVYPIYRLIDLRQEIKSNIFRTNDNVLIFHESFYDNPLNNTEKDVNDIRSELNNYDYEKNNMFFVSFSGSNRERKLGKKNRTATVPVSVVYQNLELFITKSKEENDYNLKYLVYGNNINVEPELLKLLESSKVKYIKERYRLERNLDNIFFFRSRYDVSPPFKNHSTILNGEIEKGLHNKIINDLSDRYYDNIFVPLCFGSSLSDFNGLSMAAQIRCTKTKNQLSRIYI